MVIKVKFNYQGQTEQPLVHKINTVEKIEDCQINIIHLWVDNNTLILYDIFMNSYQVYLYIYIISRFMDARNSIQSSR